MILAKLISLCLGFFIYKMGMKRIASSTGFPTSSSGNYLSNSSRQKPWCHPWLLHRLSTFNPMTLLLTQPPPWSLHHHPWPVLLQQPPDRFPCLCPLLHHLVSNTFAVKLQVRSCHSSAQNSSHFTHSKSQSPHYGFIHSPTYLYGWFLIHSVPHLLLLSACSLQSSRACASGP